MFLAADHHNLRSHRRRRRVHGCEPQIRCVCVCVCARARVFVCLWMCVRGLADIAPSTDGTHRFL